MNTSSGSQISSFTTSFQGKSMSPFLKSGDTLEIKPISPSTKLFPGQIVLFYLGGELTAHRLISINADPSGHPAQVTCKGDYSCTTESLEINRIFGTLEARTRTGLWGRACGYKDKYIAKTSEPSSPLERMIYQIYIKASLLRLSPFRIVRRFGLALMQLIVWSGYRL